MKYIRGCQKKKEENSFKKAWINQSKSNWDFTWEESCCLVNRVSHPLLI